MENSDTSSTQRSSTSPMPFQHSQTSSTLIVEGKHINCRVSHATIQTRGFTSSFHVCFCILISSPPSTLKPLTLTSHPTHIHTLLPVTFTISETMTNPVAEKFTQFYETWVSKLEEILNYLFQVLTKQRDGVVTGDQELQALVSKVTSHLKEYYSAKWDAAQEDVFIFFSPVWLNLHESVNLWMTRFKPSSAFTLLDTLKKNNNEFGIDMTEDQHVKIEDLRKRIKMEEGKLEMDMERQQVAMADRRKVKVAKLSSRDIYGASLEQVAVNDVFAGSVKIMKKTDFVRLNTLKGVLDVLNPKQSVLFLATHVATQLRLGKLGKNQAGGSAVNEEKWL